MSKTNSVFIATSLDGYIADKNGGIDWNKNLSKSNNTKSLQAEKIKYQNTYAIPFGILRIARPLESIIKRWKSLK